TATAPDPHRPARSMAEVADWAIWMLNRALGLPLGPEQVVLVTTLGKSSIFEILNQQTRWSYAIRQVMQAGTQGVSLHRPTGDAVRSFQSIDGVRNSLIRPDKYEARYLNRVEALSPAYNLMIVPGVGALAAFSTNNPTAVDAAFFYSWEDQAAGYIEVLSKH